MRLTRAIQIAAAGCEAASAIFGVVVYDPVDHTYRYALGEPAWHELLAFWSADHKTYIAQLEVLA